MFYILLFVFAALSIYIYVKVKNFPKKRNLEQSEISKCESPIEEMMMKALLERGYEVRAQEPCGKYRIDLAIYRKNRKVAIECDGEAYHSSPKQLAHDREKDKYLRKNKWLVVRFSGSEIYQNRDRCVQAVERLLLTKNDRRKVRKNKSFV